MNKIFLDTNLWIRYILMDNKEQFSLVKSILDLNEKGAIKLYTSSIIFLEISYVLKKVYRFKFEEILEVMHSIRTTRGITVIKNTETDLALSYLKAYKIKFSDCLIASQLKKDIILLSFDEDFCKIKEVNPQTPAEFLKSFKLN